MSGVDVDTAAASTDGGAVADAGRASSGAIRDQARAVAAASAPLGNSPAGAQLVVATMDQHMEAMQRQLDTTTAQNRLLALRLRELAAAYRGGARRRGRFAVIGAARVVDAQPRRCRRRVIWPQRFGRATRLFHGRPRRLGLALGQP